MDYLGILRGWEVILYPPFWTSCLSAFLRQFPFSFFPGYCVRGIITAESEQVHGQKIHSAGFWLYLYLQSLMLVEAYRDHNGSRPIGLERPLEYFQSWPLCRCSSKEFTVIMELVRNLCELSVELGPPSLSLACSSMVSLHHVCGLVSSKWQEFVKWFHAQGRP